MAGGQRGEFDAGLGAETYVMAAGAGVARADLPWALIEWGRHLRGG